MSAYLISTEGGQWQLLLSKRMGRDPSTNWNIYNCIQMLPKPLLEERSSLDGNISNCVDDMKDAFVVKLKRP